VAGGELADGPGDSEMVLDEIAEARIAEDVATGVGARGIVVIIDAVLKGAAAVDVTDEETLSEATMVDALLTVAIEVEEERVEVEAVVESARATTVVALAVGEMVVVDAASSELAAIDGNWKGSAIGIATIGAVKTGVADEGAREDEATFKTDEATEITDAAGALAAVGKFVEMEVEVEPDVAFMMDETAPELLLMKISF
jgi:hypothetical protein